METAKAANWFVRVLIIAFCGFLSSLVVYRFFYIDPRADLSVGVITLLAFVLVLILSELFDNFSVGKIVSMSRVIKEKDGQTNELKRENLELRGQVLAVVTSISQKQTSNNIFGLPANIADLLMIKPAAPEEVEAKKKEESPSTQTTSEAAPGRRVDGSKVEAYGVTRFVTNNNLQAFNVIREAKLSTELSGIDPVTNVTPIFDAYINASDSEIFVEVKATRYMLPMFRDRLYVMLTKINHYKNIKKTNVYLSLVLVNVGDNTYRSSSSFSDRIRKEFEPAITSGLLRLHEIDPTSDELLGMFVSE